MKKIAIVMAIIEIASFTALFLLIGRQGLPTKISLILVFCLPITFGMHIFEEFIFPGCPRSSLSGQHGWLNGWQDLRPPEL
jgi:hypothetical protein